LVEGIGTELDKELIISDRGYPSEEMIDYYETKGLFYLMRVREKFNLNVDKQDSADGYVQIGHNKIRVVKVMLDTGEIEILLTNLTGNFDFKELYYLRWGVELEYDVIKNTLEIENFSGRTETAIRQDFHIHIIASNMLAASLLNLLKNQEFSILRFFYQVQLGKRRKLLTSSATPMTTINTSTK